MEINTLLRYCPACGAEIRVKTLGSPAEHKYRYFCDTEGCPVIEIESKRMKGMGLIMHPVVESIYVPCSPKSEAKNIELSC